MVDGHASKDDTKTHANVPTSKLGGIGCAALIVGSEVDEHRLQSWPNVTIAQAYDEGSTIIANGILQKCKEEVAKHTDENAMIDIGHYFSFSQRTCTYETRENETATKDGKPGSCASCHVEDFFSIDGKISGKDSIGCPHTNGNETLAPTFQQKKAIEGNGVFIGNDFFHREMDGGIDGKPNASYTKSQQEYDVVIANRVVNEQSNGGRDAGGEVVGKSVVTNSFSSSRRGQHVNG